MPKYVICALYHFVILDDFKSLKAPLLQCMLDNEIKGTLLLAREGINGTVAGERQAIDKLLAWLRKDPRFANLIHAVRACGRQAVQAIDRKRIDHLVD